MVAAVLAGVASLVLSSPAHGQAPRGPVLATGDSMIQYVDAALRRRIERRVISEARVATGISKPLQLDWPRVAVRQAIRFKPAATVVFVGANDGFDMRTPDRGRVRCCGRPWRIEYARRASEMMATYAREGTAKVYWLTLPQAREGFFREVYPAVNAALRRASREHRDDVRLIRLNKTFTPRGRFRETMRWKGKTVEVRQRDGIHLSPAGADIAASLVERAMHADGLR